MAGVGTPIFIISSVATSTTYSGYGKRLIEATDPVTSKRIFQLYSMSMDGITINTDMSDGNATNNREFANMETMLIYKAQEHYIQSKMPRSVPVINGVSSVNNNNNNGRPGISGGSVSNASSTTAASTTTALGTDSAGRLKRMAWWKVPDIKSPIALQVEKQKQRDQRRRDAVFIATLPPFLSKESMQNLSIIMGEEAFSKEVQNNTASDDIKRPMFNEWTLKRLLRGENGSYNHQGTHKRVFIAFDPAGGGVTSNGAIISCVYVDSGMDKSTMNSSSSFQGNNNDRTMPDELRRLIDSSARMVVCR